MEKFPNFEKRLAVDEDGRLLTEAEWAVSAEIVDVDGVYVRDLDIARLEEPSTTRRREYSYLLFHYLDKGKTLDEASQILRETRPYFPEELEAFLRIAHDALTRNPESDLL